jgi:cell division protein FtsB
MVSMALKAVAALQKAYEDIYDDRDFLRNHIKTLEDKLNKSEDSCLHWSIRHSEISKNLKEAKEEIEKLSKENKTLRQEQSSLCDLLESSMERESKILECLKPKL